MAAEAPVAAEVLERSPALALPGRNLAAEAPVAAKAPVAAIQVVAAEVLERSPALVYQGEVWQQRPQWQLRYWRGAQPWLYQGEVWQQRLQWQQFR